MAKTSALLQAVSDLLVNDLSLVEAQNEDLEGATTAGRGTSAARFWVDIQSADSDKMRRGYIRVAHAVTISVLLTAVVRAKFDSLKGAMDLEGKIIDKMMTQSKLSTYATFWESTTREFVAEGKSIRLDIAFRVEDSYTIGSSL